MSSSSSSSPPARVASSSQIASNASSASLNTSVSAPPSNVWANSKDDYDLGEVIGVGATGKRLWHKIFNANFSHLATFVLSRRIVFVHSGCALGVL